MSLVNLSGNIVAPNCDLFCDLEAYLNSLEAVSLVATLIGIIVLVALITVGFVLCFYFPQRAFARCIGLYRRSREPARERRALARFADQERTAIELEEQRPV